MRIAILHHAFTEYGGAERCIISQAKGLIRRGHEVTCFGSIIDERIFPATGDIRPYVANLMPPKLRLSSTLSMSVTLAPLIRRRFRGYDVLLCHHEPGPWIAYRAWKRYGIPYVCYMHHPPRFIYPRPVERLLGWGYNFDRRFIDSFGWLFKGMDYAAVSNAKAVLVNSRRTAREVEPIYGVKPIVCYPGARVAGTEGVERREPSGGMGPLVLTTARHVPQKRLDWLLAIFKEMVKKAPHTTLVIVGAFTPTYTPRVKRLVEELRISRRVRLFDYLQDEELAALYRRADVYLYPPPNEDFGLGPVEAMAYGTPAIVWDEDGPAETVINGVTGFKVRPYDLGEFAEKALMILTDSDLRRKMGENAIEHAKTFSWERHVLILEEVLSEVAGSS